MPRLPRKKVTLVVVPWDYRNESPYLTTVADFCESHDNAIGECTAVRKLRPGKSVTISGRGIPGMVVHRPRTRKETNELLAGAEFVDRPQKTRRGREVLNYGERMPSDTRVSNYPDRRPRYGEAPAADEYERRALAEARRPAGTVKGYALRLFRGAQSYARQKLGKRTGGKLPLP